MKTTRWIATLALTLATTPAQAVTLGPINDFQDGTEQGWSSAAIPGRTNPNPPTNRSGGRGGTSDLFLEITGNGGSRAGSKLVSFNSSSTWTGDYLSLGITSIEMYVANLSLPEVALSLRLQVDGPGGTFVSADPVSLPGAPTDTWMKASFGLSAAELTGGGDLAATLAAVSLIRLMHNPLAAPSNTAPAIDASIGIDDLRTVPEPSTALLLTGGLVALAAARRR